MKFKKIYMDHAATTPLRKEVKKAMEPYFSKKFGNASSLHTRGQEAKDALEESREKVARLLEVDPENLYFTSSGTESNNTILKGTAFKNAEKGLLSKSKGHIITSKIEHPCIMETCEWLKTQGFDVTYVPVDEDGVIKVDEYKKAFRRDTILASVMYANNEIGTIQPIKELAKIASEKNVPFHTDAVQAYGKIPLNLDNVNALTVSSHKLYGPKGVGLLYSDTEFTPLLHGGGHENGKRAGTENVAGIVGFAKASELAFKEMEREKKRQAKLRDELIDGLLEIDNSMLNGHETKRLPNNVNVSFEYIEGESLVLKLDDEGIEASTGSACSSHKLKPSHVLQAIGLSAEEAHGSLRLTLGKENNEEHVDYVLENTPEVVEELREMSPTKPKKEKKEKKEISDPCFD